MKIISGKYRGKNVITHKSPELRPTLAEAREGLFNVLLHNDYLEKDLSEVVFLELFCGSGIVSFEAVSRGVERAFLVDQNPRSKELFYENRKEILKNNEEMKFLHSDVSDLSPDYLKADICFMDPPYHTDLETIALEVLVKANWLNNNALIIIETDKRKDLNFDEKLFSLVKIKQYGRSKLSFLKFNKQVQHHL